ncbi:MAG: xanthine dehydrogenase family protein molybdopterin-binding subunit [Nitrospinota bacterium]
MDYRVIGRRVPSVEAREKAAGAGQYASDVRPPGMLWAKVLRSPFPHARILSVDASRAERLKGVRAVLTAPDCPDVRFGHMIHDETILAVDKARFAGEEIAAVAAVDLDTAEEALELVHVEYEPLPSVGTTEEALAPGAPLIHEDKPGNVALEGGMDRGDFERAYRRAAHRIEAAFQTSSAHQCYMEPMGAVAEVDSRGRLTLYAGIQDPWIARQHYAEILGMKVSDIRMVHSFVGGGFGSKKMVRLHLIAALLAKKAGRPVRLDNTRTDEFVATHPRVPMTIRLKLAADPEGRLVAKSSDVTADNGAYSNEAPAITGIAAYRMDSLYRIEGVGNRYRLVYTNKLPTGGFRGFGNPQGAFVLESGMDMLAEELGMDPVELRLRNFVHPGDLTMHGFQIGTAGIRECVERARRLTDWDRKRAGDFGADGGNAQRRENPTENGRIRRGIGLACCIHGSGFRGAYKEFDGSSAVVRVSEEGRVFLLTGETDIGQGSRTVLAQIAAEELGVRMEDIKVSAVDTDVTPGCLGAYASRVTTLGGHAVAKAARRAREQILAYAAERLECRPEDLRLEEGEILIEGAPERKMSFSEVARETVMTSGGKPILGEGEFLTPPEIVIPDATRYGHATLSYSFAAHVAEAAVEVETGRVTIENVTAVHDSGLIINPLTAEGQVEGGVVQGLGWAVSEELVFEDGLVMNPNFYDYRIPTMADAPDIQVQFVREVDPNGPFGAKGLGEPALVPTAAAVANAVAHALGARIRSLPITPEKVVAALQGPVQKEARPA